MSTPPQSEWQPTELFEQFADDLARVMDEHLEQSWLGFLEDKPEDTENEAEQVVKIIFNAAFESGFKAGLSTASAMFQDVGGHG